MALPITPDAWRSAFARFLDDEDRAWKYLEAASCTLEIDGDSLGRCPLTFEHDPSPLRWAFRRRRREIRARLIDDSGQHDTVPDVAFYSMGRPLDTMLLDVEAVRNDWIVAPPGGLFLARHPPFEDAAVVSALPRRAGFQDLVVDPHVVVPAGAPALPDAFRLLRLWHGARQAGFLAGAWQRQVTGSIIDGVFRAMCGKNWARAEQTFCENPTSRLALEALEARVERHTGFGRRLSQMVAAPDHSEAAVFASFAAESGRHEVSHDPELCQFALRLASRQADALSDPDFDVRVRQLADTPALLRGARLVSVLRQSRRAWSDIDSPPSTRT